MSGPKLCEFYRCPRYRFQRFFDARKEACPKRGGLLCNSGERRYYGELKGNHSLWEFEK